MSFKSRFTITVYNIGLIDNVIKVLREKRIGEGEIIWMKHSYNDRYFADPFLWYQDEKNFYILAEEFCFFEEKGKISLLVVRKKDFKLVKKKIIIEESYHLSFPFCEENDEYILPESVAGRQSIQYRVSKDTYSLISKNVLVNEGLIDPILYNNNGKAWLIAGKKMVPSTELYIYVQDMNGSYRELFSKPLLTDKARARSAGRIFEYDEHIIRPVQDCTNRYGRQTRLIEIENIDENGYYGHDYAILNSDLCPPYNETMHTFNVYNGIALVDGSVDRFYFPMRIFYKMFHRIFYPKHKP